MKKFFLTAAVSLGVSLAGQEAVAQTTDTNVPDFKLNEASISSIANAVRSQRVSCEKIVASYISRIETLDKAGSKPVNAVIAVNPMAIERAREIDASKDKRALPLACAPLIIKDNVDVKGMPTTAGSRSLADNVALDDATQVARLEQAGAIVLAKANLAEFAWTADLSDSSLGGLSRNPYDVNRTTGGSSGGTAAAVAANFGVAGLGTDTGASIRGPSALQNLVGLRPTLGASSRDGVVPIWLTRDTLGPMARSVEDVALIYQVTYGYDPKDASTQASISAPEFKAASVLKRGSLAGMRIGVLRQNISQDQPDPSVMSRFDGAISDLTRAGAVVVDVSIKDYKRLADISWPVRMEYDFNAYLRAQGDERKVKTFADVVKSGLYNNDVGVWLKKQAGAPAPDASKDEESDRNKTSALRTALVGAMDRDNLAMVIYPTWTQPARNLEGLSGDGGNANSLIAHAGLPAITVPMGDTPDHLPTGLQFAGRPFSENVLVSAAYDYEQLTRHRTAPESLPPAVLTGD